jgi:hypothetical protein
MPVLSRLRHSLYKLEYPFGIFERLSPFHLQDSFFVAAVTVVTMRTPSRSNSTPIEVFALMLNCGVGITISTREVHPNI